MMKVLQMLLRTPGGKKAAAALWRTMNKGKGLARSTKRGIKRDLYPGYKELMGRGRKPASNEDVLRMYERVARKPQRGMRRGRQAMTPREIDRFTSRRHPGDPTGKKMKDSLPGVTYGAKGEIISGTRRGIKPGLKDKRIADKWHNEQLAKQYLHSSLRPSMSLRDQAIARDVLGMQKQRRQMQVNPELKRMYDRVVRMSEKPVRATRRKPRSIYGRTKAAMKPAYNKMRNLRRRLREKGLV